MRQIKQADYQKKSLTHEEVLQAGKKAAVSMEKIITSFVKEL